LYRNNNNKTQSTSNAVEGLKDTLLDIALQNKTLRFPFTTFTLLKNTHTDSKTICKEYYVAFWCWWWDFL